MTDFKSENPHCETSAKFRNFVFTCNNWTDESVKLIVDKLEPLSRYIIYGKEVGKKGTPHLQGYCQLKDQTRRSAIKKILTGFWFAKAKGNAKQASDYCRKDDDYYEWGTMKKAGKRTDIHELYDMIKENKTDFDLQEYAPATYVRYYKGLDRMRFNYQQATYRGYAPVKVTILWGGAGVGKTRTALENDPDLYFHTYNDGSQWFDGYIGQKTVLFDEFYGQIKYSTMLKLLDGYRFRLPIKGGFTWKMWENVVICSNQDPQFWYSVGITPALKRRFEENGSSITFLECKNVSVARDILPGNL